MLIYFHNTSMLYISVQEYLLEFSFIFEYILYLIVLYKLYIAMTQLWSVTSTYFK